MAGIMNQARNQPIPFIRWNSLREWLRVNRMIFYLLGVVIGSGLIYGLAFIRIANLFELYEKPRLNLYTLPSGGEAGLRQIILAFVALALLYWLGWLLAGRIQGKIGWIVVIGGAISFGVL